MARTYVRPHARLAVRRRRIVAVTALVLVLFPLAKAVAGPAGAAETRFETYVVRSGDTLWDVAVAHEVAGDPRSGVQILLRLNPDAAALQPGMALRIPLD